MYLRGLRGQLGLVHNGWEHTLCLNYPLFIVRNADTVHPQQHSPVYLVLDTEAGQTILLLY